MKISCDAVLSGGTRLSFDDETIAANSVSIKMSTCRENKFDFGTFNAAELKIGLIDDDALDHDFSGAKLQLAVSEIDKDGDEVQYDMGEYFVDPTQTKREKNTVYLVAYDAALKFDREIPDNVRDTGYTALSVIQTACGQCGVNLSGGIPTGSPNSEVTFKLSSAAVQTWRDAVMWACQLICANAIINRDGMLEIRKAWYTYNADADFTCTAADRVDIDFSDTRVYIKHLTSYSGNSVKTYESSQEAPSQSVPGTVTLSKNPLYDGKTEEECDTINTALLSQPIVQRQIKAKMFSSAGLSLGDLGVFRGGKIDVRRAVRGWITSLTWKYHGYTSVVCTAPDVETEGSGS